MDAAHYGNLAGATDIIFHPGSYFERPADEVLPVAIERLQGCVAELRGAENQVILRPETMGKSAMLGSLADTIKISLAVDGIKPCVDVAHLHARTGDGSINSYEEWTQILDEYGSALGEDALRDLHLHISGIEYGEKGEKEHLPLDESDFNYEALFRALNDYKCQGRILCESPVLEEDALKCKQTWCEISQEDCS
jgi:deoxyribonuclease-4